MQFAMRWAKLLVVASCLVASTYAYDNTYLITAPQVFRPGRHYDVSVSILKATSAVVVDASLERVVNKTVNIGVARAQGTFVAGVPGTIRINVPADALSGLYRLWVRGSGGLKFENETNRINFQDKTLSIFVQTDKAIYNPSQKVRVRVLAVNPDLKPYLGPLDIETFDPHGNKVIQWMGVQEPMGVATREFDLSDQPVNGTWKFKVTAKGQTQEKTFTVDEFVLPKFEVKVTMPSYALRSDNEFKGTISATYTFGKPVEGTAKVRINFGRFDKRGIDNMFTMDGKRDFYITRDQLNKTYGYIPYNLQISAEVTDKLTGTTQKGEGELRLYENPYKVEVSSTTPNNYKPGLTYTAFIKVVQPDDMPITGARDELIIETRTRRKRKEEDKPTIPPPTIIGAPGSDEPVRLSIIRPPPRYFDPYIWEDGPTFRRPVPDNGVVRFDYIAPSDASGVDQIQLTPKYKKATGYKSANKMHSPSGSFLQVRLVTDNAKAGTNAEFEVQTTEPVFRVTYQIIGRGTIVESKTVALSNGKFSVLLTPQMGPKGRIIVYYIRNDAEVVTDSINFQVEGAIENEVSVSYDKVREEPGKPVNVKVTADPGSTAYLLAVDQSVLLLKSGNDITEKQVFDELDKYDTTYSNPFPFGPRRFAFRRRRSFYFPWFVRGSDAEDMFRNAGIIVLTDTLVYNHMEVRGPRPRFFARGQGIRGIPGAPGPVAVEAIADSSRAQSKNSLAQPDRVRKFFPETWLWQDISVGPNGMATLPSTVPDTITSWVASAFAMNPSTGLGVAPVTAKLESFRPFFVTLNLPFSVVRGEHLVLHAIVFNYLDRQMDVTVTLEESPDFGVVTSVGKDGLKTEHKQTTSLVTVKSGEGRNVFFPIVPKKLGKIDILVKAQTNVAADAIQKQLLVEAEGIPQEFNDATLIETKQGKPFFKTVPISLPPNIVEDSKRAEVTVIGDLLGPTLSNLDKLLRLPTGCGEQTMISFAPDVFVTKYLKTTGQLNKQIENKALDFMRKGYGRELSFQHPDGSYSAWGPKKGEKGSTWLTAFVAKSFHQAKPFIFIDDKVIEQAVRFVLNTQSKDGTFPEVGKILDKFMQGGTGSGAAMTAFVLISLLENRDVKAVEKQMNEAIPKATAYLEGIGKASNDSYELAIISYALTLAGSRDADLVFAKLNSLAKVEKGMKFWGEKEDTTIPWWRRGSRKNQVEMASYALLVYAHKKDINGGLPVLRFLMTQRNSFGGFYSTQDTVVGLQALTEFVSLLGVGSQDMSVTIQAGSFSHTFTINRQNAMILQKVQLPDPVPNQVSISASGKGSALFQVTVTYNLNKVSQEPAFDLSIDLLEETTNKLDMRVCSRWLKEGKSGMTIEKIGVPAGFTADKESVKSNAVQRVETDNKNLILYFDEIGSNATCVEAKLQRTGLVANTQAAAVEVTEYYEPGNSKTQFYQSKALKDVTVCNLCEDCEVCKAKPKPEPFTCNGKTTGFYGVEGVCQKFYFCLKWFSSNFQWEMTCAPGTAFNGRYCDTAANVKGCNNL